MSEADDRLRALFAADAPPARDPHFSAAVIEALERRQFLLDVGAWAGACLIGAIALWGLWPAVKPALTSMSQQLAPAALLLAAAVAGVVMLGERVGHALGFES
jgi:hypothetical protein